MTRINPADLLAADDLLSIADVARLLPHKPSTRTVARWTHDGIKGRRLRSVRIAGRRLVRKQWVLDFIEAIADDDARPDEERALLSCTVAEAEAELAAEGV